MREGVKQVVFSWILLRPITLSGIRAWHWNCSRQAVIDTWSASLSTLAQTAASSLTLAMGNAAASDVWRTECPKDQCLHLCCLTSISVTSLAPCPSSIAMLIPGPPVFPQVLEWGGKNPFFGYAKNCWVAYLSAWRLRLSTAKTTCTAFHLNNRESSRKLAVIVNSTTIPYTQSPTYLGAVMSWLESMTRLDSSHDF